ncbi:MAG: hypothetical protein KA165_15505 [Saprospiraceae bacterium]|nr:hypothetical protein [Saprospiraceae bacterium]
MAVAFSVAVATTIAVIGMPSGYGLLTTIFRLFVFRAAGFLCGAVLLCSRFFYFAIVPARIRRAMRKGKEQRKGKNGKKKTFHTGKILRCV